MAAPPWWSVLGSTPLNVQDYGAVGDFVHDDTPAFQAWINAMQGANVDGYVPNPPVAYRITSEILVEYNANWTGSSTTLNHAPIRAATPGMRSIFAIRSTFGKPVPEGGGPYRSRFRNLTFDANLMANNCVFLIGAAYSEFKDCNFRNAPMCGIREAGYQNQATLSAVTATVPGGSPAGVTVTQLDLNYIGFISAQTAGTYTLRLQCTTAGALDTAQFAINENGAGLGLLTQPISATANIAIGSPTGVIQFMSGLQARFPAGTYHVADHWDLTFTVTNSDTLFPVTANWKLQMDTCSFVSCGWTYPTSATGQSWGANQTFATGTLTLTAASNLAVGVGTTFTTMRTAGWARAVLWAKTGGNGKMFQIIGALSDTVLALNPGGNTLPTSTQVGLDYAIGTGAGDYDDGVSEIAEHLIQGCRADSVTVTFCHAMFLGSTFIANEHTNCDFFGGVFGATAANGSTTNVIIGDTIASGVRQDYYLAPGSSGTIIEPHGHAGAGYGGDGSGWMKISNGKITPLGPNTASNLPIHTLQLGQTGAFAFTTGGETIPAPDLTSQLAFGSLIQFTTPSAMTLTGTPILTNVSNDGVIVYMQNIGSFVVRVPNDAVGSSSIKFPQPFVDFQPNDMLVLVSRQSRWMVTGGTVVTASTISGAVAAHGFVSATATSIPASPGASVVIATVSVTTTQVNQRVQVHVTGSWNPSTLVGLNTQVAALFIDGASVATRSLASAVAGDIVDFALNWEATIATAASHTFDVRLNRSAVVVCSGDADITVNAYTT